MQARGMNSDSNLPPTEEGSHSKEQKGSEKCRIIGWCVEIFEMGRLRSGDPTQSYFAAAASIFKPSALPISTATSWLPAGLRWTLSPVRMPLGRLSLLLALR